jgi:uncharacterized membrane protein
MARRSVNALVAVALVAVVCAAILSTGIASTAIRLVPALLLILLLPALPLASALPSRASWLERFAIALAATMALVALATVLLDALGINIGSAELSIALAVITVATCAAVAIFRRSNPAPDLPSLPKISRRDGAFVAAGVILLVGAGIVTALSVERQRDRDTFTQLWAQPGPDGPDVAQVGITNHEGGARTYVVSTTIGKGEAQQRNVSLGDGETSIYEQRVDPDAGPLRISLTGGGAQQSVSLNLHRAVSGQ